MIYKVIQWGTGNTGSWSIRELAQRPDLELVAVRVYSPDKDGTDAGVLSGIEPVGVLATVDRATIIDTPADVVVYMGSAESNTEQCALDIIELLSSGKNVVSTPTPFQHPHAVSPELGAAFEQACATGGSTFLGLGLYPGFMGESVPIVLSRICHTVERISVAESMDYDEYPSTELMFNVMGFGFEPDDTKPVLSNLEFVKGLYVGAARILAEAFELELEDVVPFRQTVVSKEGLDVASGHIAPGTVAAMRMGVDGFYRGRKAITVEHCTRMDPALAPDWPSIPGYTIEVIGEPSFTTQISVGLPGQDHTDIGCLATAAHALNAIPAVVAAPPGVRTLADIGHFHGGKAFARFS
jgi:hypothetical protein